MDKNIFLNHILSILPTSIESINSAEKIGDSLIITNNTNKYVFRCYETKLPDNSTECKTFYHKDLATGEVFYKDKIKYKTDKEAIDVAVAINTDIKTIHKRIAYKCTKCGFWHVGRNNTILTEEDKEKIKRKHLVK